MTSIARTMKRRKDRKPMIDPNIGDNAKCPAVFGIFAPIDTTREESKSFINIDRIGEAEERFFDVCGGEHRYGGKGRLMVLEDVPYLLVQYALPPEALDIPDDWTLVEARIVHPGEKDFRITGKAWEEWLFAILSTTQSKH